MGKPTHSKIQREAGLRNVLLRELRIRLMVLVFSPINVQLARQTQMTVRNIFYRTSETCLAGQSPHTCSMRTTTTLKLCSAVAQSPSMKLQTTTSQNLPFITAHGTLIIHNAVTATTSLTTVKDMATTEVMFDPRNQIENEETHYTHRKRSY